MADDAAAGADTARELAVNPCRTRCSWRRTPAPGDEPLFACRGCGSQWVPSEPWTPVDTDGVMPAEVRAARSTC